MMMQLNPPLPVDTTHGPAYAHMVIDYSQEHYVLFVCFLMETGECWVLPNRDVKLQKNLTMGIRPATPAVVPPATLEDRLGLRGSALPYPHLNGNGATT